GPGLCCVSRRCSITMLPHHRVITNTLITLTLMDAVRSVHAMERAWRWAVAAFAACLLITACGTGTDEDRAGNDAADTAPQAPEGAAQQEAAEDAGSDLAGEGTAESERDVITSAYAAIEVDDPEEAVGDLLSRTSDY